MAPRRQRCDSACHGPGHLWRASADERNRTPIPERHARGAIQTGLMTSQVKSSHEEEEEMTHRRNAASPGSVVDHWSLNIILKCVIKKPSIQTERP